jgi:hypothetical protein
MEILARVENAITFIMVVGGEDEDIIHYVIEMRVEFTRACFE